MSAPDSLETTADALNRPSGTGIARIGLQRHPQHAPGIEGVAEHQQLGLSVTAGALGRGREPGTADLRHGRDRMRPRGGASRRPGGRPGPVVQVQEAGRANDGLAAQVVDRERERPAGALVRQGCLDVTRHRRVVCRYQREVVGVTGLCPRLNKGANVAEAQWLKPDAAALQGHSRGHGVSLRAAHTPGYWIFAPRGAWNTIASVVTAKQTRAMTMRAACRQT